MYSRLLKFFPRGKAKAEDQELSQEVTPSPSKLNIRLVGHPFAKAQCLRHLSNQSLLPVTHFFDHQKTITQRSVQYGHMELQLCDIAQDLKEMIPRGSLSDTQIILLCIFVKNKEQEAGYKAEILEKKYELEQLVRITSEVKNNFLIVIATANPDLQVYANNSQKMQDIPLLKLDLSTGECLADLVRFERQYQDVLRARMPGMRY